MCLFIGEAYSIESDIPFANDKKAKKARKAAKKSGETMSCDINNYKTYINSQKKTNLLIRLTGEGCQLRDADLSNKNFSRKSFKGADLRGVDFTGSRFTKTDFKWAKFNSSTNFTDTYVFDIKYSDSFPWDQFANEDEEGGLNAEEAKQVRTSRLSRSEKEYLEDIKDNVPGSDSKIEGLTNTEKKIFYGLLVGRSNQGTRSFYQGVSEDLDSLIENTKTLVIWINAARTKLKVDKLDNPDDD